MNNPKVSVIVPIYKDEQYLYQCIEYIFSQNLDNKVEQHLFQCIDSICSQTLDDIEIILVDEGEEDASLAIMSYFAEIDSRVRIIHKRHGGYGASVNAGIKASSGKYIAIVDSDDFIEKTMLENLFIIGEKNDADIVIAPYYEFFDSNEKASMNSKRDCPNRKKFSKLNRKTFTIFEHPEILCNHTAILPALYKRKFMKENEIFFDETAGAEYVHLNFRLDTFLNTKKIVWLDQPCYDCRKTNRGFFSRKKNVSAMLERWQEVCEKLQLLPDSQADRISAPLIHELYYTAISWLKEQGMCTIDQAHKLESILDFFKQEHIAACTFLGKRERNELRYLKRLSQNEGVIVAFKPTNGAIQHIKRSFFDYSPFVIHLRHNRFSVHILPTIHKKIFSQHFIFFNVFSIELVIGNK